MNPLGWHPTYFSAAPSLCTALEKPTPALKPQDVPLRLGSSFALGLQHPSLQPLSHPHDAIWQGSLRPVPHPSATHVGGAGGCRRELSPASGDPKFERDSPLTPHFPILKSLKVCSTFCRNTRHHLPAITVLAEPFAIEFASKKRRLL